MSPPLFPFANYPLLFGHRGCSKVAPENTLASFRKILDHGVPGVELDVHLCRSGELVVMHDSNLKRTTGLDALIKDTDFATISDLDAGAWKSQEYAGERVPLLDDVIDLLGDRVYYDIEIKHSDRNSDEIGRAVVEVIYRRGMESRCLVSSFNPFAIRAVRRADPRIQTALIYTKHPEFPRWLNNGAGRFVCKPQTLKPNRHRLNPWSVFWKHRLLGYPLIMWTEDDPQEVRRYLGMGIAGIITNVPETMLPIVQELCSGPNRW